MPDVPTVQVHVNRPQMRVIQNHVHANVHDGKGALDLNHPIRTGRKIIPGFIDAVLPVDIQVRGTSYVQFDGAPPIVDLLA